MLFYWFWQGKIKCHYSMISASYLSSDYAICHKCKHQCKLSHTHEGAGKSLARPTSQCCRMESIVSLERGVRSCAELQVFSCYRSWKEAFQAMQVISTTSRHELSSSFFLARQGAKVAQFNHGDFSTCDAPRPGRPKTVTTLEIIDHIHELIL